MVGKQVVPGRNCMSRVENIRNFGRHTKCARKGFLLQKGIKKGFFWVLDLCRPEGAVVTACIRDCHID